MSLSKIFAWAVSDHLDDYKSTELVLLKGHLLLEVAIENTLSMLGSDTQRSCDLSFHRKLLMLERVQAEVSPEIARAIEHLHALNQIRNRLAHEYRFVGGSQSIDEWTRAVLADFPGTKIQRHTFRTKFIQALGALGEVVVSLGKDPRPDPGCA